MWLNQPAHMPDLHYQKYTGNVTTIRNILGM